MIDTYRVFFRSFMLAETPYPEWGAYEPQLVPGLWSGTEPAAAPTQDLVLLRHAP
ncbi:MAG: hypothetical protein IT360_26555 [Gemmatimonadaceae bacterium]|nr:hypothetical protein [Gemmatimonadaceae bacterium]